MAFEFVGTSSQYISANSAILTAYPITICAFINVPSASTVYRNIAIYKDATERLVNFAIDSGKVMVEAVQNYGGRGSSIGTLTANTYFHGAGILLSTTSRTAFLNGTAGTLDTTLVSPATPDKFAIGGFPTGYLTGKNAEVAIWNVELTNAEIASLAKGFKPTRIRPQSLVFYAPLLRNLQDLRGGLSLTNNNSATVADHPRVY